MPTQEKLIRRKQSLLALAEYLQKISPACKINGVSRQHFYEILKVYESVQIFLDEFRIFHLDLHWRFVAKIATPLGFIKQCL